MDANGANKTKVYTNYTNQTTNTPDYPAWSSDGAMLCFILNNADLYTLNISLVSGVPTGSTPLKIGDGIAGGGSYKQGKWRPGQNQIACVWKKTGDPDKIHLLPSAGGSPTVLYTAASTDWVIENDIAFKSDGFNLVFSERQISTGDVYLKVLDVSNSNVINSINMDQFLSVVNTRNVDELDWAKTPGSNIVALTTIPVCDGTSFGINGYHQLFTIDVAAETPSLSLIKNDVGNISISPDDNKITINSGLYSVCGSSCCSRGYSGIGFYTIATQSSQCCVSNGNHPDWKR
jgi:hypothetical protein